MRPQHRLLACGGILALAAFGVAPARADDKADALLKEVAAATQAAKTLTADLTLTQSAQGQTMTITGKAKLKKPNLARIQMGAPVSQTIASDGKTLWVLMTSANQYQKKAVDAKGSEIDALWAIPVNMFFDSNSIGFGKLSDAKPQYVGEETVAGIPYRVVQVTGEKPFNYTMKLYVGSEKLVTRIALDIKQGDQTAKLAAALTNVKVDAPLTNASFAFAPPKTAKLYEEPDYAAKLVAVGKKAPDFSLPTPTGGHLALADALKEKKALLLNFWFHG